MPTAAGNFVPFVVWFNFLAGFAYIAVGVGLWVRRRWAVLLAAALAAGTALLWLAFNCGLLAPVQVQVQIAAVKERPRQLLLCAASVTGFRHMAT